MRYLLNVVYFLVLILLAPWLLVAAIRKGKYREGLAAKLLGQVTRRAGQEKCIWLHAVSVGEVSLLGPVIMRLEQQHPQYTCVISTTTATGYRVARQKYAPRTVFYCPLDFSWAVRRAVRRIRPDLLVLAELELWPNLILAVKRWGAPVAVINGRMSDGSLRGYGRIRWFVAPLLSQLDLIAVQNEPYCGRFQSLGAPADVLHVTGSIKFDEAQTDRSNPLTQHLRKLAGIANDQTVFLAGSTQHPEERMALSTFQTLSSEFPRLRLILVPRHPERFDSVAAALAESGLPWQRRSELSRTPQSPDARILLVDVMGELAAWWGTASIAFVGGSLTNRGGQNMIEPAAYGAAVSFGPFTQNFRDVAGMMLDCQAARVVRDGQQLTEFVRKCLKEPQFAKDLGQRARQLVTEHRGAADRTCGLLGKLIALALLACSANLPAQTPGQIDPAPRAERPAGELAAEKSGPSDFDNLVTRIILDNLPHEIVQDKDWGQTRQIWDGVRMRWEGTRLDTRRRWKTVNHGTWKRYEIRLIDPQQRFQVQVAAPRALARIIHERSG